MTTNVSREQAFSVLATNFSISPSTSGYTLQVSADGINFTDLFAVGANVTRMVTGVASGSYYRLSGNTDTDIVINWQRQCDDGQGGGGGSTYILPAATQTTLGGVKVGNGLSVAADGTLSANGGGGSGEGVVYVNHLSDTAAVAAPVGTLVVVNYESDSFADATWENGRFFTMDYANLEADTMLGKWEYNSSTFTLYSTINDEFYIRVSRSGNSDVDYALSGASGSVEMDNMGGRIVAANYTNDAGHFVLTFNQSMTLQFLGGFEKTNEHNIYIKVNGGEVASWNGFVSATQTTPMEIIYDDFEDFVDFADGEVLFAFKYRYGSNYRYAAIDKNERAIILYSDDTLSTEVLRAYYLGEEARFAADGTPSQVVIVQWKENEITLRFTSYIETKDRLDFHIDGVHYHRITDETKATASNLGIADTQTGFPIWNNEGIIVGRDSEKKNKGVQFNYGSNTYSHMAQIVCTSGEGEIPSRMYVPTQAGTAGQILTFNTVDSAPVWTDWIKAVKTTSADYEALATKDPNTLYLIVD